MRGKGNNAKPFRLFGQSRVLNSCYICYRLDVCWGGRLGEAKTSECSAIEHKPVKVEAWLSKRYEKDLRQLRKEFAAMGNTRVTLWVYPGENLSKIIAIGRCVPS